MTLRQSVRETFRPRLLKKRTTVLTALTSLLLSMGIARQTDPVLLYAFFLSLLGLTISLYPFPERIYGHPAWRLDHAWLPILSMLGGSLLLFALLIGLRGFPVSPATSQEKVGLLFLLAIIVPSVEEFARWTWLHTLPYSPVTSTLFWVLLHPAVAVIFAGKAPDLAFLAFAMLFGLAMTWVMWMAPGEKGGSRFLGPVAAITLHGAYNAFVVLWVVSVSGVPLHAF